jgi:RNA polymerase sigma-70 factor (ECF subfamily)
MSHQERDLHCMRRLEGRDELALAELYDRYTPLLYPVALRILRNATDAEEAVQRTWMQVWKGAAGYDPRRGTVAAWLVTVVRTRALDLYRSLASRRRAESQVEADPVAREDPTAPAAQRQLSERMRRALATLEPRQRQVLEIAYFEGLSQSEVAERLQAPLGTVKSWTRQALLQLRARVPVEELP